MRVLGDASVAGNDMRRERDAFIADENVTSLSAFRISARAKTLPTTATAHENPHFGLRFTAERTRGPRRGSLNSLRCFADGT